MAILQTNVINWLGKRVPLSDISSSLYSPRSILSSKIKFLSVIQLEPWREVHHGTLGKVGHRLLTVKQLN